MGPSEARDADAEIFGQFEGGVTAGILEPMPRAPAVFEELTQWQLGQEALAFAVSEHANYSSVERHARVAQARSRRRPWDAWRRSPGRA